MGLWDILLLIGVTALGTLVAYVRTPRHKVLVLCIPIPFTFATLAVGSDVNATHALGMITLLGFWLAVYALRHKMRLPIIPAIALAALAYCTVGALLAGVVPRTETSFWIAEALLCGVAVLLYVRIPHRAEQAHSSILPVWIKIPVLVAVVLGLIAIKSTLSGFMATFPMVGVLTAYEARYSLWTAFRQMPVALLSMAAMIMTVHGVTPHLGIGPGLVAGWVVLAAVLIPLTRHHWSRER